MAALADPHPEITSFSIRRTFQILPTWKFPAHIHLQTKVCILPRREEKVRGNDKEGIIGPMSLL
jgi:hypothetical protein